MARNVKKEEPKIEVNLDSIKEELKDYVDERIKEDYKTDVEKFYKKQLRDKTKKIIAKDIVIILLLVIILILLYFLYTNKFFHQFFVDENNNCENNNTTEIINHDIKEDNVVDEENLIKEYSYLLNSYKINAESEYVNSYSKGLTSEIKNYLILETLDFSKLEVDEDYNIIDGKVLEEAYNKLFTGNYEKTNFEYLGNKIKYLNKLDSYLTSEVLKKSDNYLNREIVSVEEDGNKIIIVSNENNKEVTYTFINKKLSSISE